MTRIARTLFAFALVLMLVGCDQATKSCARHDLEFSGPVESLGGWVRFQYSENEGGFLGIGSSLPYAVRRSITVAFACLTLGGMLLLLFRGHRLRTAQCFAVSMMLAGAAGNIVDRLFNHGKVIDFVILGKGILHTGIFNAADVYLLTGMILLLAVHVSGRKVPPQRSDGDSSQSLRRPSTGT
jgi:signal peptidase II